MAYPHAGFGNFLFQPEERPEVGSDSGWKLKPTVQKSLPGGANKHDLQVMAIGSSERSFEILLSRERIDDLEASLATTELFTDWSEPIPDSREAFLMLVDPGDEVRVRCPDGTTAWRRRTTIELVSQ